MKRLTNLLCVTSLAAVVAHAGVQESHSLLIKVQPGDMARYSVKMVFSDGAQKIEMTGMAQDRITKVEEDGTFTNEHVLAGVRLKIQDQEIDVTDEKRQTSIYKNTGEIVEILGTSPGDNRFAYVTSIVVPTTPIKDGETWTRELTPKGGKAVKLEFQAIGSEKVGNHEAVKIKFKSTETSGPKPVKAEGHAWIATKDGRLARMQATVDGVPMGQEGKPTTVTVTMERVL
jgi:hypothetical protein